MLNFADIAVLQVLKQEPMNIIKGSWLKTSQNTSCFFLCGGQVGGEELVHALQIPIAPWHLS